MVKQNMVNCCCKIQNLQFSIQNNKIIRVSHLYLNFKGFYRSLTQLYSIMSFSKIHLLIQNPIIYLSRGNPHRFYFKMSLDYTKKTINGYAYFTSQRIGNGFSSEVYLGIHQKTKEEVAIKVISKARKRQDDLQMVDKEIKCLQAIKGCANILQIKNAIHTKNNIYIVTQFCERGSLADALSQSRKFSQPQAISCILQIINGFRAIVQKNFVHRDLKLVNIFITSNDQLKIGDLGFTIDASLCKQPLPENVGSPLYEAPETLTSNIYSVKSDIWAIGIIFIEMLLGKNPWKSTTEIQLAKQLALFNLDSILPSPISKKSKQFLSKCLKRDIAQRMSSNQLFSFCFTEDNKSPSQIALKNVSNSNLIESKSSVHPIRTSPEIKQKYHAEQLARDCQVNNNLDLMKLSKQSIKLGKTQRPSQISIPKSSKSNLSNSIQISQQSTNPQESPKLVKYKKPQQRESVKDSKKSLNLDMSQSIVFRTIESEAQKQSNPQTAFRMKKVLKNDSQFQNLGDQKSKKMLKKANERQSVISNSQMHKTIKNQKQSQGKKNLSLATPSAKKNSLYRKPTLVQKQILLQTQSQINYFRFLNKLLRKIHDILKTNDQKIMMFKKNIFYLINNKIKAVRDLKGIKQVSPAQLKEFQTTVQYQHLQEVLKQYQERYDQENQKDKLSMTFESDKEFHNLLSYVMKILYQNVAKIQQKAEEFNRKKGLAYILQDLIELTKLHSLDKLQNWHNFLIKSNINKIIERVLPTSLDEGYWLQIKKRFLNVGNP